MSFDISDIESQIAALQEKFKAKGEALDTDMKKAINTCCLKVERDIKENMSPNSPSAPGEPPAVVTGRLRASITHRVQVESGEVAGYVGTNVEYAPDLEFGTSKILPRPFMLPALQRNADWIKNKLKDVERDPKNVESET
ncbi:MAG TPA: HK97 gp10 family phage protein [Ruminococcus flavefaciens]|nr:HK97 gp10 family phage protein [Ruminococcus flavefaciens]